MSTIQEYVAVIGCFQGLLLFSLLFFSARMTQASRILGVMCLLIALVFLMPFFLVYRENLAIAWLHNIVVFLPVALGPLGYLYCRSALLETPLVRQDLIHILPVLFCYGLTIDISLNDPFFLLDWAVGEHPSTTRLNIVEFVPFVIASAYAAWAGLVIWRYRAQANNNLANFNPMAFSWLLILQLLAFLGWSLKTLAGFIPYAPCVGNDIANWVLGAVGYLIATMQWRNPQFFTITNLAEARLAETSEEVNETEHSVEGELDPDIRAELFETITNRVENGTLYLDGDLNLSRLATLTGVNKHHLSEVLNKHAGKNFYEFINEYRIAFVRNRLAADSDQTILDIAFEAGFTSKSTFNAVFKQFTGQTPSQYRRGLNSSK
ncbi:MAG: AraC family transcriptional regulator [Henriciella sp.]|nr:AraC family transcriptional regulator [Henriciella sp.]